MIPTPILTPNQEHEIAQMIGDAFPHDFEELCAYIRTIAINDATGWPNKASAAPDYIKAARAVLARQPKTKRTVELVAAGDTQGEALEYLINYRNRDYPGWTFTGEVKTYPMDSPGFQMRCHALEP